MKAGVMFRVIAGVIAAGALIVGALMFGNIILNSILPAKITQTELDTGIFGKVEVSTADVDARGLAIMLTQAANAETQAKDIKALARAGIITVALDLDHLRAELAKSPATTDCHYVSDDLKDLAREVEKNLQLRRYFYPIIIGRGSDGGAFAYAAMAQAPVNTLGGAISIGFEPVLHIDRTFCFDKPLKAAGDGLFALAAPAEALPDPWRVIAPEADRARIEAFQDALDDAQFIPADTDASIRSALVNGALRMGGGGDSGVSNLPVSIIEPEGEVKALALIVSGDGGWRDIDREIGEWLAKQGVAVVGVDSLRYFWSPKQPREIAADLTLLYDHYGKKYGTKRFILAGYSFGADILPGTWAYLPKNVKDNVALISMLGLGLTADYEVSLEGFVSAGTEAGEPLPPLLSALPQDRTQCIYGKEDAQSNETSCTAPELGQAERVALEGGHHFDGDYTKIADVIWQRFQRQTGIHEPTKSAN